MNQGNQPPTADPGGPYDVLEGQDLELDASDSVDPNQGCGDAIVAYEWDLDRDGIYDHESRDTPQLSISWADIEDLLPVATNPTTGAPSRQILLRVTDSFGIQGVATTELRVYRDLPVAQFTASPSPAACGQAVTFDASISYHGNPDAALGTWEWDFDDDGEFETIGMTVERAFDTFGSYRVTLRVTEAGGQGRSSDNTSTLLVDQGNRPPTAALVEDNVVMRVGETLSLDASPSLDPDGGCGDRIVSYEVDLDDDGAIDHGSAEPALEIPWSALETRLDYPAEFGEGEPANRVTVRVTDSLGQSSSVEAQVRVYADRPTAVATTSLEHAACGQSVTFDGSDSHASSPSRALGEWAWDFDGDGVADAHGETVEHAFASYGVHTASLRVTDDADPAATHETTVVVSVDQGYTPPVADAGGPLHGVVGAELVLDASSSTDPDTDCGGGIVRYDWDLDGDTVVDTTAVEAVYTLESAALSALGFVTDPLSGLPARLVTLTVTDAMGAVDSDTTTLRIYEAGLTAAFTVAPNAPRCGERVTLDGTASSSAIPGLEPMTFEWDLDGDGQWDASGATVEHVAPGGGPWSITLRIGANGLEDRALETITVRVPENAPVAHLGGPYALDEPDALTLDASASEEPDAECGDRIVRYEWDLDGDGAYERSSDEATLALSSGELLGLLLGAGVAQGDDTTLVSIRLRVADTTGLTGAADGGIVVGGHYGAGPRACFDVSRSADYCGDTVGLDAGCSRHDDPDADVVAYAWDLDGDGETDAEGPTVEFTTTGGGEQAVTLRVIDGGDPPRSDETTVSVSVPSDNAAPLAAAGGSYEIEVGQELVLDGSASSDPNGPCGDTIVSYAWDLDDDGVPEHQGAEQTWTVAPETLSEFARPAEPLTRAPKLRFRLTVRDGDGAEGDARGEIVLWDNAPRPCVEVLSGADGCADTFRLSAACSSHGHPDHTNTRFEWDLDRDGEPDGEGAETDAQFGRRGAVSVALTVWDDNEPPRSRTEVFDIDAAAGNRPPVADPGGPYTVLEGEPVELDATSSRDPDADECGDTIVRWDWDLDGDGDYESERDGPTVTLDDAQLDRLRGPVDPTSGEPVNRVKLRVTDSVGATGTGETTVTLYDDAPRVCFEARPNPVACGEDVTLDATCTQAENPAHALDRWEWDWDGDGEADAAGETAQTTFRRMGPLAVTVTVWDGAGRSARAEQTVNVSVDNQAPTADAGGPYELHEGEPLLLDGSASVDPDAADCGDALVAYRWDLDGDGTFGDVEGVAPTLAWETATALGFAVGARTVVLEVEDRVGATHRASAQVRVRVHGDIPDAGGAGTDVVGGDVAAPAAGAGGSGGCAPVGRPAPSGAIWLLALLALSMYRTYRRSRRSSR